jgi:general stress protein 26
VGKLDNALMGSDRLAAAVARAFRFVGRRRHDGSPARALASARQVMRSKRFCVLITDGPEGPNARVVQPFRPDAELVVHLGTSPQTRKALQVQESGRAVLVYERDRDGACVVAYCAAQAIDDPAICRRYFMPLWRAFWPDGPDRDFIVIRCEPDRLEIWDARRGITPPPFGLRSSQLRRTEDGWQLV